MSMTEQRVSCAALNKQGTPCRHPVVGESGYCNVHDPDSPVAHHFLESKAGPGAGRPSKMDEWRRKVEAEFDRVIQPLYDGLDAKRDEAPDHAIRIKASESILDRTHGKPVQRSEVSGPDGGVIPLWLQVVSEVTPAVLEVESGGVDGE